MNIAYLHWSINLCLGLFFIYCIDLVQQNNLIQKPYILSFYFVVFLKSCLSIIDFRKTRKQTQLIKENREKLQQKKIDKLKEYSNRITKLETDLNKILGKIKIIPICENSKAILSLLQEEKKNITARIEETVAKHKRVQRFVVD